MLLKNYHPKRIYYVIKIIITIYLLIKKDKIKIKPMSPHNLKRHLNIMGVTFIKIGQVLSTRADFLSEDYINALKELQTNTTPMSKDDLELSLKRSIGLGNFKDINKTPLACASIAQIHIAELRDGTKVVLKLKRYGLDKLIKADKRLISIFTFIFRPLLRPSTHKFIILLIDDIFSNLNKEINFNYELLNIELFQKAFPNENIKFPKVYKQYSNKYCLVMNYIEGFSLNDSQKLNKYNIDSKKIVNKLIKFYTKQILDHGMYHADPHPGNIIINKNGDITLIDFGMIQKISDKTKVDIAKYINAAINQNTSQLISALLKLRIVKNGYNENDLEFFIEEIYRIFNNKNSTNSNMQSLISDLLKSTNNLSFQIPQKLIYLMRTISIIEGLGTINNKNFNGIKDIIPNIKISKTSIFNKKIAKKISDEVKEIPEHLNSIKNIITDISSDNFRVKLSEEQLTGFIDEFKYYIRPYILSGIFILNGFFFKGIYDGLSMIFYTLGVLTIIYFV